MDFESTTCGQMKSIISRGEKSSGSKMPEGLNLEISQHPLTMRRVVNLVIAMDTFKASGSEFRDEDLLNILLENVVEEQLVSEVFAEPPVQTFTRNEELSPVPCTLTDVNERAWVFLQETMQLHALLLQGGNADRKVHLNMSTYVSAAPSAGARPVALGIRGTNFYLSCSMEDGVPTLNVEEYTEQLTSISRDSDRVRFLFYRRDTGVDASTLMSARYPDWYISTSSDNNKPVAVSQQSTNTYKTFTIHTQTSLVESN